MKKIIVISLLILNTHALADKSWVGQWDSNIYNFLDHPKTVALRIEVLDSETRLPIEGAYVLFKGTYTTEERTSRHPEGEQKAQEEEFELTAQTGSKGIAIAALGWQKEFPWRNGIDDIEKVQSIEILRKGYHFIAQEIPFSSFLDVGQNKGDNTQAPKCFSNFEEAWANECSKSNVKFCALRFNKDFAGLDNKESTNSAFFEKIQNKEWGLLFSEPTNRFQREDQGQRLCGPYLVYNFKIYMNRIKDENNSQSHETDASYSIIDITPAQNEITHKEIVAKKRENTEAVPRKQWQIDFLRGLKWGMKSSDVKNKGLRLKFVRSYKFAGTEAAIAVAEISAQLTYLKKRVSEIEMSFANDKLFSIRFLAAGDEAMAEKLFAAINEQFGPGLTNTWTPDDAVKKYVKSPQLCQEIERYYADVAINNRIGYTWSQQNKRYKRYCLVEISDWMASDHAFNRDRSFLAERFKKILEEDRK